MFEVTKRTEIDIPDVGVFIHNKYGWLYRYPGSSKDALALENCDTQTLLKRVLGAIEKEEQD